MISAFSRSSSAMRFAAGDLLIVLQYLARTIAVQVHRSLMPRRRCQVEAAILIISVANQCPSFAAVILIFWKIFVRAFRQKTIDRSRTF
jgi:hypothetical protein